MRRRWARAPTPPIPHEEDDEIATDNRHDNSHSDNHPPSDSPTHEQNGVVETSLTGVAPTPRSDSQSNVSENRLNSDIGSDSEHDAAQGRENGIHHTSQSREVERCVEDGSDLDDLLMRECDILREREMCRKRRREGSESSYHEGQSTHSSPISGGDSGSQGSVHTREQAKRSKVTCDDEEDMERLLAEEELMLKTCEDDHIPPGFDS